MNNIFAIGCFCLRFSTLSLADEAPAGAPSLAVDDRAIEARLSSEAQKLLEAGRGKSVKDLLDKPLSTPCVLRLRPVATKRFSLSDLYVRVRESVLIVGGLYKCEKCAHWHTNAAAGFAIEESGVLVTNYHVIKETNRAILVAMTSNQEVFPVESVLAARENADVAILRIAGARLKPLPIRPDAPVGTEVSVISHPGNRFYTLTRGLISRYTARSGDGGKPGLLQVTADFAKGASGGPILDDRGNVVGMVLSTQAVLHNPDEFRTVQMVFKDCVRAESILDLIVPPAKPKN